MHETKTMTKINAGYGGSMYLSLYFSFGASLGSNLGQHV
jgi:hypothetical protein